MPRKPFDPGGIEIVIFQEMQLKNNFLRWDLLEDKILYVFVCMSESSVNFNHYTIIYSYDETLLGMVTLPMTFLSNVSKKIYL